MFFNPDQVFEDVAAVVEGYAVDGMSLRFFLLQRSMLSTFLR